MTTNQQPRHHGPILRKLRALRLGLQQAGNLSPCAHAGLCQVPAQTASTAQMARQSWSRSACAAFPSLHLASWNAQPASCVYVGSASWETTTKASQNQVRVSGLAFDVILTSFVPQLQLHGARRLRQRRRRQVDGAWQGQDETRLHDLASCAGIQQLPRRIEQDNRRNSADTEACRELLLPLAIRKGQCMPRHFGEVLPERGLVTIAGYEDNVQGSILRFCALVHFAELRSESFARRAPSSGKVEGYDPSLQRRSRDLRRPMQQCCPQQCLHGVVWTEGSRYRQSEGKSKRAASLCRNTSHPSIAPCQDMPCLPTTVVLTELRLHCLSFSFNTDSGNRVRTVHLQKGPWTLATAHRYKQLVEA